MSSLTHRIAISAPTARSVAIAALLGITFLASPLAALAQTTFHQAAVEATDTRGKTVEQWIVSLHAALAITPAEEGQWNSVTQAMRENPAAVQQLAAGKIGQVPQGGLESLISSFEALYNSMPDPQKKIALRLFQSFGREGAPSYCRCFSSNR